MNSRDFCYWLQGWFELNKTTGSQAANRQTMEMIEKHLQYVFTHGDLSQQPMPSVISASSTIKIGEVTHTDPMSGDVLKVTSTIGDYLKGDIDTISFC